MRTKAFVRNGQVWLVDGPWHYLLNYLCFGQAP